MKRVHCWFAVACLLAGCMSHDGTFATRADNLPRTDEAEIYTQVLQHWLDQNHRQSAVFVSKFTFEVPESQLEQFTACVNRESHSRAALNPATKFNLSRIISSPRLHFIANRMWSVPDPKKIEKMVQEGRPVGIIRLSSIAFDDHRTVAALHSSYTCGSLCGGGETLVFDRTTAGWVRRAATCDAWIS